MLWNHCPSSLMRASIWLAVRAVSDVLIRGPQQFNRFPIAVDRSDIDIALARRYALCRVPQSEPGIHQRADIFVTAVPIAPDFIQLIKRSPRHFECAPYPVGSRLRLLYLDLDDAIALVCNYRIEALRISYGE